MIIFKFADGIAGSIHDGEWKIPRRSRLELAREVAKSVRTDPHRGYIPDLDYLCVTELLKLIPGEILSVEDDDEDEFDPTVVY